MTIDSDTNKSGASRGSISRNCENIRNPSVYGILLFTLILSGFSVPRCSATVYDSDGSEASVQALLNAAQDGDTITLPAGTFSWTSVLTITKGITLQGATTITGPASSPSVADATIILDNTPRRGNRAGIILATVSPAESFRLTGITFRQGNSTDYGQGGAVRVASTGVQPNRSVRIDHCHFDHLYWGYYITVAGWIYGVDDHNVFDCLGAALSHFVAHNTWGGHTNGNGSWADFPYYGTEKFWFIEDNTIRGLGQQSLGGTIDCKLGGRYLARHNYFSNTGGPGGHGTESALQRGCREREVYDNTFDFTIAWGGNLHRSGGAIWHDNTFTGRDSKNQAHSILTLYRFINGVGNDLSYWGEASGNNAWDYNATEADGSHIDGHPPYLFESGTASATLAGGSLQDTSKNWTPDQWKNYEIQNTNPASIAYSHSAYIRGSTSNTITYWYSLGSTRGKPLTFAAGDTYKIYRCLIALDQNGRGKGDLISATNPHIWSNQALEPCFSWNNVHSPGGTAYGFATRMPTVILNRDYYNLGGGFPVDSIPAQVSSTYTAALNGVDYVGEFVYPHPLVTGIPTPPPSATPRSQRHLQKKSEKAKRPKGRKWGQKIAD